MCMVLRKRVLDICTKLGLAHLGSSMSAVPIIQHIYQTKRDDEKFVLSCGHAALALYVVLEQKYGLDAEQLYRENGTHPCRGGYIACSTGSLGLGLPVAVGMALADRSKRVYCLVSDGECDEGSVWESLRFAQLNNLDNLHIYVNINGFSAYQSIDSAYLIRRLRAFHDKVHIVFTDSGGAIDWHYRIPTEQDYETNLCKFGVFLDGRAPEDLPADR